MKVVVDYDVCASTGSCMQTCPEVFEVRTDGFLYLLIEGDLPDELVERAQLAAELCPTGAISLVETSDEDDSAKDEPKTTETGGSTLAEATPAGAKPAEAPTEAKPER